ncbi:MAG: class I SAM-dependent methyltransferase [Hyphomicrobiaceae bacterium]
MARGTEGRLGNEKLKPVGAIMSHQRNTGEDLAQHDAGCASRWVTRFIEGVPRDGTLLDVACGKGRHMRLGLAMGLRVVGVDRDLSGVADLLGEPRAECVEADLESGAPFPLTGRTFDAVVVTNYLWRPIMDAILDAVSEGGLLIYETFAAGQERLGRPKRAEFLLQPGELIRIVVADGRLIPLAYEHVRLSGPDRIVQRIAAAGPRHPWAAMPPPGTAATG